MKRETVVRNALDELSLALSRADDPRLVAQFLKSLLTKAEIDEIATRWALVREIDNGVPQRAIARAYGLSLCKITRGSRELKKAGSAFRAMIGLYEEGKKT